MYFVDQEKIDETLSYMDELLKNYEHNTFESKQDYLALERMVHMTIESIIDVGNMMIDGFIMRDPGSYEDIIDILVDEKVISQQEEKAYKDVIALRNMIVKEYTHINHTQIVEVMNEHINELKTFSKHVFTYLEKEMGPITAFKKREGEV
ncbi:type VII toxin-antitoxin system HepT family RNase toxin [Alkalibacillus haloalkaliphilus]|uniref:type VII toxin-antitoxin system HepT family RNase toxin n=1 Tax=Alkalibacillus haloalkaliphilus TaxID=94136 RepID=UPI000309029E|nr:DUF86 domain-containing protein [Alkalibacillus haloalkaliphilus]